MKRNVLGICLLGAVLLQTLISNAQLAAITNQPANRMLWAGGNVTFTVGVSNAGAFSYQWQRNSVNLTNGIITTVAGNGTNIISSHIGDGGPAINGLLYQPYGTAIDPSGNLFIADHGNGRIREVNTNGIITTVAGNGIGGIIGSYSGDGGPATNAGMNLPSSVV